MTSPLDLSEHEIFVEDYLRNAPPACLYQEAVRQGLGQITSSGALACRSGELTDRCPRDWRIVDESLVSDDVWWAGANQRLDPVSYSQIRHQAISYLNTLPRLYITDGFVGWDERFRLKVRVICESACHALLMHNLLVRPQQQELDVFGEPDLVIFNAGNMAANPYITGIDSGTSVALSFENRELVILGTRYAGEMEAGIFTVANYLMPRQEILSLACAANEGGERDVSLFVGRSGTGKSTLASDSRRQLIGDAHHCWSDEGVWNLQAGCYTRVQGLSATKAPELFRAVRFGTVLENVAVDRQTRADYAGVSISRNPRAAYPIEFLERAKVPCIGPQPRNLIFLACDAFGVLPAVSRLSPEQAVYHFLSGYTADLRIPKRGPGRPLGTFSACFGENYLVWHPLKYARMLAARISDQAPKVWLVNTGWIGGQGSLADRIPLEDTRRIIDAIHDGSLADQETVLDAVFGLRVPVACGGLPADRVLPEAAWSDSAAHRSAAEKLVGLFHENFQKYADGVGPEIRAGGPLLSPKMAPKRKRRKRVAG